jgi:DedD protein
MDSRAKQRLTGAVILVALFVLLVPELLTGPKDGAHAPATPEDEGMRRYTIDLDAPSSPAGQPPAEPAVSLPPVAAPTAGPASELAQPGEAAAPEATNPAPAIDTAAVRPPAAAIAEPRPTPAQPAPRPAATANAPAPVVSAPTPAAAQAPPRADTSNASGSGRFVVQLGSFRDKANAERLVRDMTARGFATFIAPITTNGRELYRVRVGPTKDRASAEALAAQLKRMGQSGSVVPIS